MCGSRACGDVGAGRGRGRGRGRGLSCSRRCGCTGRRRDRDLVKGARLDRHVHRTKVVDNPSRGRTLDHGFEELLERRWVSLGIGNRDGTYLASKIFTRVFPLHLFRTEQHRSLAEYLALFLHPALGPRHHTSTMNVHHPLPAHERTYPSATPPDRSLPHHLPRHPGIYDRLHLRPRIQ